MLKHKIVTWVLDRYCDGPVNALEIGRVRNSSPSYKTGDGWSTLKLERHPKVKVLYSLDNDLKTEAVCRSMIGESDKVVYADSVDDLIALFSAGVRRGGVNDLPVIDFLYLDAENNAEATVGHYESVRGLLSEEAVVLIDDVYSPDGKKGGLIIPLLEKEGYVIEEIYPMALARKRKTEVT